ncbi:putative membrane protein [Rhodoligotrophos appendicifer]|uniref:DUF2189 domain-containing protein n=1 Tax=Rhodoligotrophos appendicifer TaxID=987056 RepID=UPI001185C85A|nr:DUF2189 domain-containing protein [Rhodoligotrophos appendicifer]
MSKSHVLTHSLAASIRPEVRQITTADVFDALRLGWRDFLKKPSHLIFLGLIYPLLGLILATWASGGNALQFIYPLISGFALLGPLAAILLYEISRRAELKMDTSWGELIDLWRSPALPALGLVGLMLLVVFVAWLFSAQLLYEWLYGPIAPETASGFLADVFTTQRGWTLIVLGNLIGLLYAFVVLSTTVVAFPLILDRQAGPVTAIQTSLRAMMANPVPVMLWGLIVAVGLVLGSLPLFVGLAVVMPVLGHATWHLYRKIVRAPDGVRL